MRRNRYGLLVAPLLMAACMTSPVHAQGASTMLGGPSGLVENDKNFPLEGMMVQLISKKSGVRTTVYSHTDGHYEFPKLEAGDYVLRIAQPSEYYPYVKEPVAIDGGTHLDDIVMKRVALTTVLPPTPEGVVARQVSEPYLLPQSAWMASQLTGVEWLMSLPGTAEEKHLPARTNAIPATPISRSSAAGSTRTAGARSSIA